MKQYLDLLTAIKERGTHKPAARENMPGTQSLFGYQFRHQLSDGFPLLTTKKMAWKGVVTELLWFLRGDTNIKYLDENNVRYMWHEDAYNYYKKIASANDSKVNQILKPVSVKDNTRNPAPEQVDSYSMFTFEEFCETIKNTPKFMLPIYKNYLLGDCGFQYGKVWREWETGEYVNVKDGTYQNGEFKWRQEKVFIDQIEKLITGLTQSPEGRRHIVTAIDPAHDNQLALYWCHSMFQFNCRPLTHAQRVDQYYKNNPDTKNVMGMEVPEEIYVLDSCNTPKYYLDCQLYQRSADVFLGVPLNIASYALLTEILAKKLNMIPGEYIHTFGDVHIYDDHKAAVEEQLSRAPGKLPKVLVPDGDIDSFRFEDFQLIDYNPAAKIDAKLSTGLK